jgi:hypothetical protein
MDRRNQKIDHCAAERISAFRDGELPDEQAAAVRRHLDECPDCRKEYETLTSMDNLLRSVPDVSPSVDFSRNFWKKIDAMESRGVWGSNFFKGLFSAWRPSLAAVSALVILVAGSIFFYRSGPETNDPTQSGIAENMTFYGDYEIVQNLELFENWEEITSLEEI